MDTTVSNTLLCMLMDQVRDVRHENGRLRHEVAELRAHREQSDGQVRDLRAAMAAMADAQRESTTQIRALLALFHQSPSSASLSTPPRPTPLRPTPLLLTQEASAGETGETLVDALPFLAEYDCSALIVSNLRQPFIVLRTSLGVTHLGVTHPRIAYVSPSAAAYLGFSPAELVGQMVSKLGGIGAEGKLELVQLMFEKPPSNVSTPITITSTYFIRKNGAPVRLETQHQNLWADSISKWHILRLRRVLEENVPSPLPVRDLEDLLADPLTLSVIDARLTLVSRTRALDDIHLYWRSRATYLASIAAISPTVSSIVGPSSLAGFVSPLSPITQHASWNPASLSSPSLSASSPSSSSSPATTTTQEDGDSEQTTPSSGHADGHPPEEVVAMMGTPGGGPAGLDLDELLGALRSPASASASELLLDDTAPWLQNAEGRWV